MDADVTERSWAKFRRLDARVRALLKRIAPIMLRISLGLVFVWFGVLKIIGQTPVSDLVAGTVYWLDPDSFVPLLGGFEVVVGIGLLIGRALRVVLGLFALQMAGTFLVLVVQPEIAFQDGNPLLLTTEGEFVIKNLVLLSAGMVLGSRLQALPEWKNPSSR